jgi:hypothetical protein
MVNEDILAPDHDVAKAFVVQSLESDELDWRKPGTLSLYEAKNGWVFGCGYTLL